MAFQNRKIVGVVTGSQIAAHVLIGQDMVNVSPGVWKVPNGDTVYNNMIDIYDGGGRLAYGTDYAWNGTDTATFVHGPSGTPSSDYIKP